MSNTKRTFKFELNVPNLKPALTKFLDRIDISHIILISAILRFFVMSFPNDGGTIFDEIHYIKATRAMLQGIAANAEHPPLTKIIGLISIKIFGDFWFAWRLPIVLFALAGTYVMYLLAKEILKDEKLALVAAALSCVDIIWFIHGNIFMLEMPALTFSLAFAYYFYKKRYNISAVFIGLGFLCNEKALFILLGMTIYQGLSYFKPKKVNAVLIKRTAIFLGVCVLVGAGGLFISDSIWKPSSATLVQIMENIIVVQNETLPITTTTTTATQTDYEYISNPFSHVWFMITYYSGINSGIPQITETWRPPWSWILPIGENWNNPPTYMTTVISRGDEMDFIINYRAQSTFPIWWMTIPLLIISILYYADDESKFIIGWVAGTYLPWVLWEPFKMNMPFNHYFFFTIPALCIGIPWFWKKVYPKHAYEMMFIHLLITIVFFSYYFPIGLVRTIF